MPWRLSEHRGDGVQRGRGFMRASLLLLIVGAASCGSRCGSLGGQEYNEVCGGDTSTTDGGTTDSHTGDSGRGDSGSAPSDSGHVNWDSGEYHDSGRPDSGWWYYGYDSGRSYDSGWWYGGDSGRSSDSGSVRDTGAADTGRACDSAGGDTAATGAGER